MVRYGLSLLFNRDLDAVFPQGTGSPDRLGDVFEQQAEYLVSGVLWDFDLGGLLFHRCLRVESVGEALEVAGGVQFVQERESVIGEDDGNLTHYGRAALARQQFKVTFQVRDDVGSLGFKDGRSINETGSPSGIGAHCGFSVLSADERLGVPNPLTVSASR